MKRIDTEIKKLISLAQTRHYSKDGFMARVNILWGKTEQGIKDGEKETAHQKWMEQIKFRL